MSVAVAKPSGVVTETLLGEGFVAIPSVEELLDVRAIGVDVVV